MRYINVEWPKLEIINVTLNIRVVRYKISLQTCRCWKQPLAMFYKVGILKIFTKFTGKHLCRSIFLNKVSDWRPATYKKRHRHRSFLANLCCFFFYRKTRRLFLKCVMSKWELETLHLDNAYSILYKTTILKVFVLKATLKVEILRLLVFTNTWNFDLFC